jgi:hypothetical protein
VPLPVSGCDIYIYIKQIMLFQTRWREGEIQRMSPVAVEKSNGNGKMGECGMEIWHKKRAYTALPESHI